MKMEAVNIYRVSIANVLQLAAFSIHFQAYACHIFIHNLLMPCLFIDFIQIELHNPHHNGDEKKQVIP